MSDKDNQRYYWLKLKDDFFNSDDIKLIESQKNGAEYIIFWQKLLLKAITSKDIGILRYKENIPYTPEMLATITNTNIDIVKGALTVFKKLGMIDINGNGDILIDEFLQELIGHETYAAKRKRDYRKKITQKDNVPKLSQNCLLEKEKEKEIEKEIEIKKKKRFVKPTIQQLTKHISDNNFPINPEQFYDYYEANGWKVGRNPMKDWVAAVRTWVRNEKKYNKTKGYESHDDMLKRVHKEMEVLDGKK